MSKIHVRHHTVSTDGFESLVSYVERSLEALRNEGNRILGVIFVGQLKATIFYEFEK